MEKETSPARQSSPSRKSSPSRRVLTLQKKKEILDAYEQEKSWVVLSKQFDLPDSTIRTIVSNKHKILTEIFESYLRECDRKFESQGRKIVLFLDNCTAHPHVGLKNITLKFFPPNTTALSQKSDRVFPKTRLTKPCKLFKIMYKATLQILPFSNTVMN
ncbi:DDE superfamily endonuclease domain-containing protein [Ditylenchus destructor]|uniref:DDE superfamily endonuclease domain-containing protein n=1 Tax=Ditylenchus destructor TaxID=166010 RepID=A0AAD4NIC6_9BILA|nr:DDE superfamily endonuclease domain-containing protein [Ditylenchus destructor]